jgi:SagB-type dehydrogenase family enzyme
MGDMSRADRLSMGMEQFVQEELPLLIDMVTFNSQRPISPYADSTVVETPEVCLRGSLFSHSRTLGEEYLLNYRYGASSLAVKIGVTSYAEPAVLASLTHRRLREEDCEQVSLPKPGSLRAPLGGVLKARRSTRRYSGKPMGIGDVATLLWAAQGVTGVLPLRGELWSSTVLGEKKDIEMRTAPSGGGLYPIDLHVVALDVEGLPRGVYVYMPSKHSLVKSRDIDDERLAAVAEFGEVEAERASLMIAFVYAFYRNARKYGDSSLVYALIEVGEIAQNINLAVTALGHGVCEVGGYTKQNLESLLGIDGLTDHAIHLMVLGKVG